MTNIHYTRVVTAALWAGLMAGGSVQADTIWLEPEQIARDGSVTGRIASPLQIKDDETASGGSYLEVAPGQNSLAAPPASEGLAEYPITVEEAGRYRIWARVTAPSPSDDSFWVRIDGEPWFRWNDIPQSRAWRWALVPIQLDLEAGEHRIQVGYREDGTRLDVFVITNDPAFDPTTAPAGPPPAPATVRRFALGGAETARLSWSAAPGAESYTVQRQDEFPGEYHTIATGLTGHTFTERAPSGIYRVLAVGAAGASEPREEQSDGASTSDLRADIDHMSVTAPMRRTNAGISVAPGRNSLDAPPAHGRARLDFRLAARTRITVWMEVAAPGAGADSFWVHMDDGPWVKWNDLPRSGTICDVVHDSDRRGRPVVFDLGPGSHWLEVAYREDGAVLDGRVMLVVGLPGRDPCPD